MIHITRSMLNLITLFDSKLSDKLAPFFFFSINYCKKGSRYAIIAVHTFTYGNAK